MRMEARAEKARKAFKSCSLISASMSSKFLNLGGRWGWETSGEDVDSAVEGDFEEGLRIHNCK